MGDVFSIKAGQVLAAGWAVFVGVAMHNAPRAILEAADLRDTQGSWMALAIDEPNHVLEIDGERQIVAYLGFQILPPEVRRND